MKRTICLAIHSLQAGGMERVMAELANYFASKSELRVVLILYGIKRDIFYGIRDNVLILRPPFAFEDGRRFRSAVRTMTYLRRAIRDLKPDVVLSFGEYWNSFVLLATYGTGVPVIVSDRSQPDKSLGKMHDLLRRILYPRAAGVIAQTEKAKEIFLRMYDPARIAVIGNPIRVISSPEGVEKENIVLMIGRFIRSKNQEALISSFLNIGLPDWKLVLVGYDHLKQENLDRLKKVAREMGGGDKVIFAGKQNDVDDFYRRSRIFAFTSLSEGFPNVIGEAMAAGLPVVAFDCVAGPGEMIEDGKNGFLIPLHDNAMFTDKLALLMRDGRLRVQMGNAARQSIRKFSVESIGERFLDVMGTQWK